MRHAADDQGLGVLQQLSPQGTVARDNPTSRASSFVTWGGVKRIAAPGQQLRPVPFLENGLVDQYCLYKRMGPRTVQDQIVSPCVLMQQGEMRFGAQPDSQARLILGLGLQLEKSLSQVLMRKAGHSLAPVLSQGSNFSTGSFSHIEAGKIAAAHGARRIPEPREVSGQPKNPPEDHCHKTLVREMFSA